MLNKNDIERYIQQHHLLSRTSTSLVAVSGGADSVALLTVLLQLGYHIEAAHCNFHLRGSESDRDEEFVRQLCHKLNIPLHLAHFDTTEYATLHKVSIEMAARELRYNYFEQLRKDLGADVICVAHHRDDAIETLLMNLMRGTGIHGLTGIRPRNGHIVRPLLAISRRDITEYLDAQGQGYVTDSTNLNPDAALRNQIRLRLIPLLNDIASHAAEGIARTAGNMAEAEKVYNAAISQQAEEVVSHGADAVARIDTAQLMACPSAESLMHEITRPYGFSTLQTEQVIKAVREGAVGRIFSSDTHELLADRSQIIIEPRRADTTCMTIPETGLYAVGASHLRFTISNEKHISTTPDCATLDADTVTFPLTVRNVADGDRFHPYGMKGTKLVSDYLTDRKLSVFDKRRQLVVTNKDGRIVWLVGQRTDHRFRITEDTKRVLTIRSLI